MRESLWDAGRDLLLGTACVGCGSPGRVLCAACDAALPRRGRVSWPAPVPHGLVTPYAAGPYDGLLRALVLQHKEHGVLALAEPLGRVLAGVLADLLAGTEGTGPAQVVPVPSRRSVVRRRGHDPLLRLSRAGTAQLRRRGLDVAVRRLLVASAPVRDQAGLGAADRAANLAGAMRLRSGARVGPGPVVVVDDVLTTGSTVREAQRALEQAGVRVAGVGVLAATVRRGRAGAREWTAKPDS